MILKPHISMKCYQRKSPYIVNMWESVLFLAMWRLYLKQFFW